LFDFVEHGLLQVEQLFAVVEDFAIETEVVELQGEIVDLVLRTCDFVVVDLIVPVERSFELVALFELDELLFESARLVHDSVADCFLE